MKFFGRDNEKIAEKKAGCKGKEQSSVPVAGEGRGELRGMRIARR
jgi:hypothetical protein